MSKRDEDLMQDYIHGDGEALGMLFERHKKTVFNYAFRLLGNRADAEDAAGDVFLKLMSKQYTIRPDAKFTTWLLTVAHHICISRLRQKKNVISFLFRNPKTGELNEWDLPDPKLGTDQELMNKETARLIREAMSQLPIEQKEALILREYHQLNYADISQVLECSVEKIKILIFRGRQQLRKALPSLIEEDFHG